MLYLLCLCELSFSVPAPRSVAFWLHTNVSVLQAMGLGSGPLEAKELLLWDTEVIKEIHGPCHSFQSSHHSFHIEISTLRLLKFK